MPSHFIIDTNNNNKGLPIKDEKSQERTKVNEVKPNNNVGAKKGSEKVNQSVVE
jgi:hypothetical protein